MQHNNKNEIIATQLETISQQIVDVDKTNTVDAISIIRDAYNQIELIAQDNEIPILRAIAHWMVLNIDATGVEEEQKLFSLLDKNCYSNWIDILASLLHQHELKLLPVIHHSLTSPDWIVKPSAPLLTGLASWLAIVKIENEQYLETLDQQKNKDKTISNANGFSELDNNENLDLIDIDKDIEIPTAYIDVISNQIAKAEEANEDALIQKSVFEEIDLTILEKNYLETDDYSETVNDLLDNNEDSIPLLEDEKSNLDDESFDTSNLLDTSLDILLLDIENETDDIEIDVSENNKNVQPNRNDSLDSEDSVLNIDDAILAKNDKLLESFDESIFNNTDTDNPDLNNEHLPTNTDNQLNETDFEDELSNIYQRLISIKVPQDVFSANKQFKKQLDHLVQLTNDSSTKVITPITEWCQRNIMLFEDNSTEKIKQFIRSGDIWAWIEQLHNCLNGSSDNDCLENLTDTLTRSEWLEPIDTSELEALLINLKNYLNQNNNSNDNKNQINATATVEDDLFIYPELQDDAIIDDAHQGLNSKVESSGFQMTWDDDTHPELLMVYLEETPSQIEELLPLLKIISNNKADEQQKHIAARLAHTIKGGSAVVGITALAEISSRLESILDYSKHHAVADNILTILPEVGDCFVSLFEAIQLQLEEPSEFLTLFKALDAYSSTFVNTEESIELNTTELPEFINKQNKKSDEIIHTDQNIDDIDEAIDADIDEVIPDNLFQINEDLHSDKQITSGFQLNWDDDTHPELLMVYLEETPTQINELVPLLKKISDGEADADEKHVASRMAHTIKGASAIVGITVLSEFSYRLETLLDHSVKFQLPNHILELLPEAASCIEQVFEAVQMQDEEPQNYFELFKQLDEFVKNIEDHEEPLELTTPELPDFITKQNNSDTEKEEKFEYSELKVGSAEEDNLNNNTDIPIEIEKADHDETISEECINSDTEYEEPEYLPLEKLTSNEDVTNIIVEIDNIVMNLVSISSQSKNVASDLENYLSELQQFDLIADISGYSELSLLSQWCQINLNLFAENNGNHNTFLKSGEVWTWIEHVGAALNEPNDMSHMSSLSVELMREDWAQAIDMDDLQTVLLALRNINESESSIITTASSNDDIHQTESDEIISWDLDVHPELLAVYFNETPDQINEVAELLHIISKGESNTEENKKAARIAHTIKGASGVVGLNSLVDLTHSLEDILDYSVNNNIPTETAELLAEASDCLESLFETIQNKQAEPQELPSVLERLTSFSESLTKTNNTANKSIENDTTVTENQLMPSVETLSVETSIAAVSQKLSNIDTNKAFIRVPVTVIDKLINLAGELVTTSSQVSDSLANSLITNNAIRSQDERVHNMLNELTNTIVQQEKDQQQLLSSLENSDFDTLEMDSYNELHSVASLLSESIFDSQEIDVTLNKQLNELNEKLRSLDKLNKDFSDVILSSRMVSINTIVPRLERIVRQTCRKTDKKAQLIVTGNDINIDTDILNGLVDPLLHMLRNSIDHGIETSEVRLEKNKNETGLIELSFTRDGNNILMSLTDDGAGIDPKVIYQKAIDKQLITPEQEFSKSDTLKLILEPGFSTQENVTDISGRGVGMDVVNSSVENLKGSLSIDSELNFGTTFNLTIPVTLITNTTLLVKASENTVAIPTDTIEQILYQEAHSVIRRDDSYFVIFEEQELEIQSLANLLGWTNQTVDFTKSYNVLIIKSDTKAHAIHIDNIISSREVVIKPLSPWISSAKGVIGACHLTDGGVAPVINLLPVVKQAENNGTSKLIKKVTQEDTNTAHKTKQTILVVDDSMSNRKALSLIIDKTDHEVLTAVDGLDALKIMNESPIDLVFTDLEMPRMNGLELTQAIRAWNDKMNIPVVMITSRTTTKHRELANRAGVDDYLTKPVVTETLLESIEQWLENSATTAV